MLVDPTGAPGTSFSGGWASLGPDTFYTTAPEMKGTPAAPYPLATRGHFYEDDQLVELGRAAGFADAQVLRPDIGAQLLVARP